MPVTLATRPGDSYGLRAVLRTPSFRSLLLSQGVFDLAVFMRLAAQSWVVFDLTGSEIWVGAAAGARAAPVIAVGLLGGVIADRFDKRAIISGSLFWISSLVMVAALLTSTETAQAWHYVVIAAGIGLGAAAQGPSFFALVAEIIPRGQLSRANGMVMFVGTSGEMVGPALVGLIIASLGAGAIFWIVAAGYAAGGLLVLRVRAPARRERVHTAALADLREAVSYARRTQPLPWLVLLIMVQNLLAVAVFPLLPVYAEEVLDVGPGGFGLMGAAVGAGLLCSAAIVALAGTHHRGSLVMLFSGIFWDACMVGFGFSRSFPLSLALLFVMGLSGIVWVNAVLTMFQSAASEEMRGRVMSLYVLSMDTFPIGWLWGGTLAAWLGNEEALVVSALCGTPVMLLAMALSPQLRRA
jgi:MFS family permease